VVLNARQEVEVPVRLILGGLSRFFERSEMEKYRTTPLLPAEHALRPA
jgi:hypothetical protein